MGGRYDDAISSHNFVVDAWLRGGVLMAVLMAMVLLLVVGRLLDNLLHARPGADVVRAGDGGVVLPLVRMFTIGAGLHDATRVGQPRFCMAASAVYARELAAARRGTADLGKHRSTTMVAAAGRHRAT